MAHFCDENGQFDFIQNHGWGGHYGTDILLRGIVDFEDGSQAVVLLKMSDIEEIAAAAQASADDPTLRAPSSSEPLGAKAAPLDSGNSLTPKQIMENRFMEWRAAQQAVPTYAEEVEYIRQTFGKSRDKARAIRARFVARPPGRPRTNKAEK